MRRSMQQVQEVSIRDMRVRALSNPYESGKGLPLDQCYWFRRDRFWMVVSLSVEIEPSAGPEWRASVSVRMSPYTAMIARRNWTTRAFRHAGELIRKVLYDVGDAYRQIEPPGSAYLLSIARPLTDAEVREMESLRQIQKQEVTR